MSIKLLGSTRPGFGILACECGRRIFVAADEMKYVCDRCGERLDLSPPEPVAVKVEEPAAAIDAPSRKGRK